MTPLEKHDRFRSADIRDGAMTDAFSKSSGKTIAFSIADAGSQWTGGTNYIRSLVSALHAHAASEFSIRIYVPTSGESPRFDHSPSIAVSRSKVLDRRSPAWLADKISTRLGSRPWLSNHVLKRDSVLVHSHASPTRDRALRSIGWIPDFQHVHLPALFSASQRASRDRAFRDIAEHSDRVILSSEDARQDLLRFAPNAAAKSRVLRFAALPQDPWACSLEALTSTYALDGPYFYAPNQLWVHKNHALLIAALKIAVKSQPNLRILSSGGTSDYRNPEHFRELQRQVSEAGIDANMRFLGLIPYDHIAPLMVHSTAMVNPSLFEGWSTTVEEGKALGVPLLLSDIAVHREQAAGHAWFFAPRSAEELADALLRIYSNTFPGRTTASINEALNAHDNRIADFASAYVSIVRELVD